MSIDKSKISNLKSELATIELPISKSIANRLLLLQAIHGDSLLRVSSDMPDDVIVLHDALEKIREVYDVPGSLPSREGVGLGLSLNLKNCGTALRFLEVHLAKCYPDEPITLTGEPRLMERKGKPTSQTTSALILHGEDIPIEPNESPYITMTRKVMEMYKKNSFPLGRDGVGSPIEADWSAAAFWYEYIAIHGGELLLEGLTADSIQGDQIVADIYAQHFGVQTTFTTVGAVIKKEAFPLGRDGVGLPIDFTDFPDLYPAIALTCEKLGIQLEATGTERLKYKESDRLEAVRLHEVRNDHRIAMALIAADFIDADTLTPEQKKNLQTIIVKSYPEFVPQIDKISSLSRRSTDGQPTVKAKETGWTTEHITPQRGINDDNLGKKHALSKLIHAAKSEYVWLHDDDVELPLAVKEPNLTFPKWKEQNADLIILPLRMESSFPSGRDGVGLSLLEKLQIAEYAAIQELTMRTAKRGKAVMCSGANLIVRREVWLACESELHPEIPSGDDMFLLEAVKRRGFKIGVLDEPAYTAVVRPLTSWKAFWQQRMRWAGKAPKYIDKDIRRCGALIVAANLLQLLCPLILLIKFPIEYGLIRRREALYTVHHTPYTKEPRTPWYVALLLEVLYPFYILLSLLGGLFRQKKW